MPSRQPKSTKAPSRKPSAGSRRSASPAAESAKPAPAPVAASQPRRRSRVSRLVLAGNGIIACCLTVLFAPYWYPKLTGRLQDLIEYSNIVVTDQPAGERSRAAAARALDITGSIGPRHMTALKADTRGHFEAKAEINGHPAEFMVDTGATSVALRYEDAMKFGLHPETAEFNVVISTANGTTKAAKANLSEVKIGDIRVRNVDALIVPAKTLATNLLGMSFMRRLSKVEMTGDQLEMRQ